MIAAFLATSNVFALVVGGGLALRLFAAVIRLRLEAEFAARNAALFEQLAHLERANAEHHCPPASSDWAVLDRQGAPSLTPR